MSGRADSSYSSSVAALSQVLCGCDKHRDLKHFGEKRVSLAYASTPLFITEGSQANNSNRQNPGRQELMHVP